jgi:hypothetical protein
MEVGVPSINSVVKRYSPCFDKTDCVGVIKVLEWARDNKDGERLSFSMFLWFTPWDHSVSFGEECEG